MEGNVTRTALTDQIFKLLKKITILSIFVAFNSSIYAMSGDGGNIPSSVKQETMRESLFTKLDGEIVYGNDTGLTREEFIQFKKNYFECLDKLDWINEHGYRKDKDNVAQMYEEYFKGKINLNALDKLEELGWYPGLTDRGLQANILFKGGVILTGHTTDSVVYEDNLEKNIHGSIWEFKVDKIIRGKELMNEGDGEGSIIYLKSLLGKRNSNSGQCSYLPNTNYILLLHKYRSNPRKTPPDIYVKVDFKCFAYQGEDVWTEDDYQALEFKPKDTWSKVKYELSYSEIIKLIEEIEKVNDTENFYKRQYSVTDRRALNKPKIKDTFILENVWPDQNKLNDLTEDQFMQIKNDYMRKCNSSGMSDEQGIRNSFWVFHINANKLDEFRKLGIHTDYKYTLDLNLFEFAFYSQAVIIGKVLDTSQGDNKKYPYSFAHTIEIKDILAGDCFIDKIKNIKLFYSNNLKKGELYCFFLSKLDFEWTSKHNNKFIDRSAKLRQKMTRFLPKDANDPNVFTVTTHSSPFQLDDLKELYLKQFQKEYSIDEFKATVRMIDELNDKANFYSRSYK
jgi:hypothetical protein